MGRIDLDKLRNANAVVEAACKHMGVSVSDLSGHKRSARIVRARKAAIYAARKLTGASWPSITCAIGKADRSHTSALYLWNAVHDDPVELAYAIGVTKAIQPQILHAGEWVPVEGVLRVTD